MLKAIKKLSSHKSPEKDMTIAPKTTPTCPFENVKEEAPQAPMPVCPFHKTKHLQPEGTIKKDVSVNVIGGTFTKSGQSAQLLKDIGGSDRIMQMTTRFYSHAFEDKTLDKFMFMSDGAANHGKRLGDWIVQKMGGEGEPWTASERLGMRQPSHAEAWHCEKRDAKDIGTHFKLDDCRIWMRLMFWSAREVGLDKHEPFMKWYIGFIRHFVGVYERSAPAFAEESAKWSLDPENIAKYIADGHQMLDVIGVGRESGYFMSFGRLAR